LPNFNLGMFKSFILMLALFALASCRSVEHGDLVSPSGRYQLSFDINDNRNDGTKYKCVILKVYNTHGLLLSTFQTGASDYSKWAVGWHPINDTVILNSSDIGTYTYMITNAGVLKEIKITPDLSKLADSIFNQKYK